MGHNGDSGGDRHDKYITHIKHCYFIATLAGTILLVSCAGMGSGSTTSLFTAAGFRAIHF
jgi:hypothetical protein